MTTSPAHTLGPSIELEIGGMTCASCAMRIEKKLNKIDGVTATVNYATEKAQVRAPEGVDTEALIAEVAKAGYTAALPRSKDAAPTGDASEEDQPDTELIALRQRLLGSVTLAVPVIAMSMIPAFQFDYWQWLSLQLATPVVLWGGWPFFERFWSSLKTRRPRIIMN